MLEAVEAALPTSHVELDLGAAAVVEVLARRRLATETDPQRRAEIQLGLSFRLHNAGRYEEARALAEEAVAAYDLLAQEDQQVASWVRLVNALTSLAWEQLHSARWEEALRTSVRALTVCEAVMSQVEDLAADLRPFLASVLSTLGWSLASLSQCDDALVVAEHEVGILGRLVAEEGDEHLAHLAGALDRLAARHAELRRWDEAVEASKKSLEILRSLARIEPLRHAPSLARTLTNITAHLSGADRHGESLAFAQEAIDVSRRLVSANPDRFQYMLAAAVSNYGAQLLQNGQTETAADHLSEGAALFHALMTVNPLVYATDAATALYNLAIATAEAGHWERALAITNEAIELRRERCGRGQAEKAGLAAVLNTRARLLHRLGRRDEAIEAIQEGLALLGPRPPVNADLASTLCLMAVLLVDAGRPVEALPVIERAVKYWAELDRAESGRRRLELAASVSFQAGVLLLLLRPFDALPHARRAVELYRSASPPASAADWQAQASALWHYARACADTGTELPQALRALAEVVSHYQRSDANSGELALASGTLADVLEQLGFEHYAADVRRQLDEAKANGETQIALPFPDIPVLVEATSPPPETISPDAAERVRAVQRQLAENSFEAVEAAASSDDSLEAAAASIRLAQLLEGRGDISAARAALARAAAFGGGAATVAILEDARLCYVQGDTTTAMINWLAVAAAGDPTCAPVAEFNLAVLLKEQGETNEPPRCSGA